MDIEKEDTTGIEVNSDKGASKLSGDKDMKNTSNRKEKEMCEDTQVGEERLMESDVRFKKPILPDLKCTPQKLVPITHTHSSESTLNESETSTDKRSKSTNERDRSQHGTNKDVSVPYTEPSWSGVPDEEYKLEVLKSGVILETIDLSKKSYHVVGRLPTCDIPLANPTISRYHAIFQYRPKDSEQDGKGLYLYDLGSTQGTFWNGSRIKPKVYVRVRGGHFLRFGCSQRKYILQAPSDDQEEESAFSVAELKERRRLELEKRAQMDDLDESSRSEKKNRESTESAEEGINWGMREDADEETDLTENPYASGINEELYLDDPKKTLRGWFEREGYELQYKTEERGIGQFLCWVDLPIDGIPGGTLKAEALVRGKKKEAVIQCALEACRTLDRHGLLRQANHEARKKKTKNWEERDYYDSDEDNFFDRTGSVEKKREQRMRLAGKLEEKVETYDSLLQRHRDVTKQILRLTSSITSSGRKERGEARNDDEGNEDALDAYMSALSSSTVSKSDVIKMKLELQSLRKEEERLVKLVNLTRPADLPPIVCHPSLDADKEDQRHTEKSKRASSNAVANIGQRRKGLQRRNHNDPHDVESMNSIVSKNNANANEDEDDDDDDDDNDHNMHTRIPSSSQIDSDHSRKDNQKRFDNSIEITETQVRKGRDEEIANSKKTKPHRKRNANTEKEMQNVKTLKMISSQNKDGEDGYYYSTWVPSENQTGDGKTSLNDRYGY